MAADKMKEILKHFPELEDGWKEMEDELKTESSEREMLSLKYREMLQREILKENLPEPEFTKAKREESDSKVMKSKEMPEKVYLLDYNDAMVTPLEGDTVYVREDAFIEKACDWMDEHCKLLTSKDYKDFKNYMKGE